MVILIKVIRFARYFSTSISFEKIYLNSIIFNIIVTHKTVKDADMMNLLWSSPKSK